MENNFFTKLSSLLTEIMIEISSDHQYGYGIRKLSLDSATCKFAWSHYDGWQMCPLEVIPLELFNLEDVSNTNKQVIIDFIRKKREEELLLINKIRSLENQLKNSPSAKELYSLGFNIKIEKSLNYFYEW